MSRVGSQDFSISVHFSSAFDCCIQMNMQTIVIPSSAPHELAARKVEQNIQKIQVTENRNLLLLEVFHQSRRFCIISYKSPIQTELME